MLIAFVLALQTAIATPPVESLGPGHPALRADRVRVGIDTLLVVLQPKAGPQRLIATLYRAIQRVHHGDHELFREVHYYDYGSDGTEYDTLEVDAHTLQMVRIIEVQGKDRTDLTYDGIHLRGVVAADGAARQVDTAAAPFFHDMMDDSFTGMYPFDSLKTFRVRELRPPEVQGRDIDFQAVGDTSLSTAVGLEPCIVVTRSGGVTMWVSRTDGHLVRLRVAVPDGGVAWRLPKRDLDWIDRPE